MDTQEITERVERSRAAQGLPARVQDQAALSKVAALLMPAPSKGARR